MSEGMEVDVAALVALAGDLAADAAEVATLAPAETVTAARSALPGSDVAAALGGLPDAAAVAYRASADGLGAMSRAAALDAAAYSATEHATATGFGVLEGGN